MTTQTWFTSDTHFGDAMIIPFCRQNFLKKDKDGLVMVNQESINEMNQDLITQWNTVVKPDDVVWHLGDFGYANQHEKGKEILKQLNGQINLVMGNHDTLSIHEYYNWGFNRVYDHSIIIDDWWILSHEPVLVQYPYANIYGHVHLDDHYTNYTKLTACVCVERHKMRPIAFQQIKEMLKKQNS